jgi:hypothetical protein
MKLILGASPKSGSKKPIIRIFWKLLSKTWIESLYLCGFRKATVEMEMKPARALTLPKL